MERLTRKITNVETGGVLAYTLNSRRDELKAYRKLGELEDAEEQGLILRLPCKVGDIVFEASKGWDMVLKRNVASIAFCAENRIFIRNGFGDSFEFGVEVFLTQEEAEAALEKMKGGEI